MENRSFCRQELLRRLLWMYERWVFILSNFEWTLSSLVLLCVQRCLNEQKKKFSVLWNKHWNWERSCSRRVSVLPFRIHTHVCTYSFHTQNIYSLYASFAWKVSVFHICAHGCLARIESHRTTNNRCFSIPGAFIRYWRTPKSIIKFSTFWFENIFFESVQALTHTHNSVSAIILRHKTSINKTTNIK